THMESAYLDWKSSVLEISRTVSMAKEGQFEDFKESVNEALNKPDTQITGSVLAHTLTLNSESHCLEASIDLAVLEIENDYPEKDLSLGETRRIKQVSVTLPALIEPYQDIQAVLSYIPTDGCSIHTSLTQTATSHGFNDSGMFQINFDGENYLPFEGLPINSGKLVLHFQNADKNNLAFDKQESILRTLSNAIFHIKYTIQYMQ
ncbi:hypothetical protein ACQ96U_27000, partial [Zooshikella sp. RANM57]